MKLAIQGCCHGELNAIYASLLRTEREQALQIDALLLCGDFQAIRNHSDLHALSVPQKYRQLGDFHAYYSGQKVAPILTLVIGGNHEASNYMHELYHGGWLAPNIYFLGAAGVVELNGLVVAGISGIYKEKDYNKGRFEKLPYDTSTIRSCYHTRVFDVKRLQAMHDGVDVVMSHDWPNTIEQWGNTAALVKKKPFFKDEIRTKTLGSPPLMRLLQTLKPKYWFSAHLHVKFAAIYNHDTSQTTAQGAPSVPPPAENTNPEALDIDLDSDTDQGVEHPEVSAKELAAPAAPAVSNVAVTRFLALHKCLPATPFLQIINHPSPYDVELESRKAALHHQQRVMPTLRYNKRWLAITRAFHPHFSLHYHQPTLPDLSQTIANEERWVEENIVSCSTAATRSSAKRKQDQLEDSSVKTQETQGETQGEGEGLDVHRVQQFVRTAPAPFERGGLSQGQPAWYTNPQTEAFCHFLGVQNKINPRPDSFQPPHAGFVPSPQYQTYPTELNNQLPAAEDEFRAAGEGGGAPEEESETTDPNALAIDMDDLDSEGDEHHAVQGEAGEADMRQGVLTLSDDDELHARWKEGTG